MDWFAHRLLVWIPLVLSLTVHEWAHAVAADRLGDDTARRLGRLTLDPLAHLDPIGTVLLPLLGVPIGWAKPVPVNPIRFRRSVSLGMGMAITAAAGPVSNLALAGLAFGLRHLLSPTGSAGALVDSLVFMNVGLAVFNLLPVPPLDGSRIVDAFVPRRLERAWSQVQVVAPLVLAVLIGLPVLLGLSLPLWSTGTPLGP